MNLSRILLSIVTCWAMVGCASYDKFASGYTRTYSIGYTDAEGRTLNTGATFMPLPTNGYSK